MTESLFREGGPFDIRRIRPDEHSLSIPIPAGDCGRIARACPSATCSPGYFRVKPGTGLLEGVEQSYCPYCRYATSPEEFATEEQIRYAKNVAIRAQLVWQEEARWWTRLSRMELQAWAAQPYQSARGGGTPKSPCVSGLWARPRGVWHGNLVP